MNITTVHTDARITKTGYETNRRENKYGEFAGNETFLFDNDKMEQIEPIKEETKKTDTKRVKLSEMSDTELKDYYRKKEEEKKRRERVKQEIAHEKRQNELKRFKEEVENMSYIEIENKYMYNHYVINGLYNKVITPNITDIEKRRIINDIYMRKRPPRNDKFELKDIPLFIICFVIVAFIFITGIGI